MMIQILCRSSARPKSSIIYFGIAAIGFMTVSFILANKFLRPSKLQSFAYMLNVQEDQLIYLRKMQNQTSTVNRWNNLHLDLRDNSSLTYQWQPHSAVKTSTYLAGKKFNIPQVILDKLEIPLHTFSEITTVNSAKSFVFATAANRRYFTTALDAVFTVQKYFPGYKIYFFGLDDSATGLYPQYISQLKELCWVEYVKFNFEGLPGHVRSLYNYAWKPLVIHNLLRKHPGVFWIDSSIRFVGGNITGALRKAVSSNGTVLFNNVGVSIFSTTHAGMYTFLPTDLQGVKATHQREANCMLLYRTRETYYRVILWLVLCALDVRCIAPTDELVCRFRNPETYAGCHRFDQSAINILLGNRFNFQLANYSYPSGNLEDVRRFESNKYTSLLRYCM